MRKIIKSLITNPLFAGSTVMIIGSNSVNVLSYLYHLALGRLLGPAGYGELASLISLIGLLSIVPASLSLVVIRYVSSTKNQEDLNKLINWFKRKILLISLMLFLIILTTSPLIASFLNIKNSSYLLLIAFSYLFSLPALVNRSILQGLLKFKEYVLTVIGENMVKLLASIPLVVWGFGVGGAMVSYALAVVFGWVLTYLFLKPFSGSIGHQKIDYRPMIMFVVPVAIQSIASTSLYSSDLILVKHFFPAFETGLYASLSTLGKIIFFGAGPIGSVMFSVVSHKHARGDDYNKIFKYSFFGTLILALGVLAVYGFIPGIAINVLYGPSYLAAQNLLIWFGIFITLFTLSNLLVNFYLSIGQTKVVYFSLLAALVQITLIWLFHNNLLTVILISTVVVALLLLSLLIYLWYGQNQTSVNNSSGF